MNANEIEELEIWAVARLGRQLLKRGRQTKARSVFRGLVSLRPRYGYGWHMLGVVHRQVRNTNRAIECFRRCLEIDADALASRVALAETLYGMGRQAEAVDALRPISEGEAPAHEGTRMRRARAMLKCWTTS